MELIHGEIDGENSPSESSALNAYLLDHPEARSPFEEVHELSAILARVTPVEPPANLRKYILNAMPPTASLVPGYRRAERGTLWSFFVSPKVKYAYAFAAGLAIGALLLLLRIPPSGRDTPADTAHLSGTIMPDASAELYRSAGLLNLQGESISGSLGLSYSDAGALAQLDLHATEPADVEVSYDPQSLRFGGIRQFGPGSDGLTAGGGTVRFSVRGEYQVLIAFSRNSASLPPLRLKITRSGATVYEGSAVFGAATR